MRISTSSSTSFRLKAPSPPPSFSDGSDTMEGSDTNSSVETKSPLSRSNRSTDAADLFVLLCSFLLVATSIALVALVFYTQGQQTPSHLDTLSILQRVISSLSVTITSAVIMVAGKRFVLFKLAREGLHSRRVAVYSNPLIGNIASYLVSHGPEPPLLGLVGVWSLALVTGLTVGSSWEMGPFSASMDISIPFGPFAPATPGSSWSTSASEQLNFVVSSVCLGMAGIAGLINISSPSTSMDQPVGIIYYPPLPYSMQNVGFSLSTTLNGFNISMEPLSSVPSTAQNITCASTISSQMLSFDGSDSQTLSIIATDPSNSASIFRFSATAIIMGGTLSSTGNYTEFAPNGTSWPNAMPIDSQWAQDIAGLMCNTSLSPVGNCKGTSFSDFASLLNTHFESLDGDAPYTHWSTMLNMALGAYSSVMYPSIGAQIPAVPVVQYGVQFTTQYGLYILMLNIVVSFAMLLIVVRLRLASRLGSDFINSTRLLLDPLKKPELFNASLKTTIRALQDPYMLVSEDGEFLLMEKDSTTGKKI